MKKGTIKKKVMAGAMAITMAIATLTPTENVFANTSTSTNITFGEAEDLTFNTSITEEMSSNDNVRYYKFTLDEANELNIRASTNSAYESYKFIIYDENRTEVCRRNEYGSSSMESIYLTGGNYYLKLETQYYISFTVTKDSLMETFKETQTANNDSLDDAYTISLSKQYKGVIAENDTKDYFKVEVPAIGKVHVNIKNAIKANATVTAITEIYDDSETLIYSKGTINNEIIDEDVILAPGTYYLKMYRNNDGRGSYSFKLDYAMSSPKISSVKNSGKKKMTIKWSKVSGADGYELQYSKNKNFKRGVSKKSLKSSAKSVSYRKLSKGKTYYVRIRSYVKLNGKKKYSGWSRKKSVVIKK